MYILITKLLFIFCPSSAFIKHTCAPSDTSAVYIYIYINIHKKEHRKSQESRKLNILWNTKTIFNANEFQILSVQNKFN